MPELAKKLEKLIETARASEKLTPEQCRLIERSLERIRSEAHRLTARRARGSQLIANIRQQIQQTPDWTGFVSDIEKKVINTKFNPQSKLSGELSNTEAAQALGMRKQMVAYYLKTALRKIEDNSGKPPVTYADITPPEATSEGSNLMEDSLWQSITLWWRHRKKNAQAVNNQDLAHLGEILDRLKEIEKEPAASNEVTRQPGRKSPDRFRKLRLILLKQPDLLFMLTPKQQEVISVGLALAEAELPDQADLGFRRFKEGEMTFQNFNYFVREVLKRLNLNL